MVNAFWLDRDLERTARWLVDSHVLSSVFEASLVLTTAVQLRGYPESEALSFSHPDHPLTQWAAASHGNWERLREYAERAHEEWRYRWDHPPDRTHGSWTSVESLDRDRVADLDWPGEPSDPPRITDGWDADDYVEAYRLYYANEKRHLFEWSRDRAKPGWIEEYARTTSDGEGSVTNSY